MGEVEKMGYYLTTKQTDDIAKMLTIWNLNLVKNDAAHADQEENFEWTDNEGKEEFEKLLKDEVKGDAGKEEFDDDTIPDTKPEEVKAQDGSVTKVNRPYLKEVEEAERKSETALLEKYEPLVQSKIVKKKKKQKQMQKQKMET